MLDNTRTRPRRLVVAGLAAVALAAPALATAPASAAPAASSSTVDAAALAPAAARVHELSARAGRAGAKQRKIYVTVGISSSDPAEAKGARAFVQRLRGGAWRTVGSVVIKDPEGPPVRLTWRAKKAATLRVTIPKLALVAPRMKVPAAPKSTKSRYYVRKDKAGDGGAILRVFKGGTAYGISYAGQEFSCVAGKLGKPWLRLTSYDFGGWSVKYRTTGTWKRLTIHDDAKPVGGPRTSLSGKNKRFFRFCAAPVYAAVTTDPNGL